MNYEIQNFVYLHNHVLLRLYSIQYLWSTKIRMARNDRGSGWGDHCQESDRAIES
jgi:hypothetical protein